MKQKNLRSFLHKNYHWVVALIMFLMAFAYGGAGNNLASLHIKPVSEYLGISRATFSLAGSARTFVSMVSTFFSGFFITRFGIRRCSSFGMLAGTVGYGLLACVKNVTMLSVANGLLGISSAFCSTSAAVYVARVWFHRHSGTVLGVITAATGLGGSMLCTIQTAAMEISGFRGSYTVCAVAMAFCGLLVALFVRNKPQDIGLVPLGDGETVTGRRSTNKVPSFAGFPMQELWKSGPFYLILLCVVSAGVSVYLAFTVVHPYIVDCGYTPAQASAVQSTMMLLLTGVKILTGYLNDHLGAKRVYLMVTATAVISLAMLGMTQNYYLIFAAVIVYTCSLPLTTLLFPLLASDFFGYRAQPQYTGIILSVLSVTSFGGEYFSNMIRDRLGSYQGAFFLGAGLALLSILLFFIAYLWNKKAKSKDQ